LPVDVTSATQQSVLNYIAMPPVYRPSIAYLYEIAKNTFYSSKFDPLHKSCRDEVLNEQVRGIPLDGIPTGCDWPSFLQFSTSVWFSELKNVNQRFA
jgi:hypothetical protein